MLLVYQITEKSKSADKLSHASILHEQNFSAWGLYRDPNTWAFTNTTGSSVFPWFNRGYTSHEYHAALGLLNMNARMYDPATGRVISPDPYVVDPHHTQAYNRFSYCLNNPMKYTDPSGEITVGLSWMTGFMAGFFSTGSNRVSSAFNEANLRALNKIKITGGLFISDPNKSLGGRVLETISRFTWQLPQTLGGYLTANAVNTLGLFGGVSMVEYAYGATSVTTRSSKKWGAVAQGSFIVGDKRLSANAHNSLFQHEYGHYLQSQAMGFAYYPRIGIPSIRSDENTHDFHPVEQDANRRAFLYFNKNIEGFQDDFDTGDDKRWNFSSNPLDVNKSGKGQYVDYSNLSHLNQLNNIKVQAKWYDYAGWLLIPTGPVGVGLFNASRYNR